MGVADDINWLKDDEEGSGKIFLLIAGRKSVNLRELKGSFGSEDWWPVKAYVKSLIDRGIVVWMEGSYRLTEYGRKVLEGFKAIEYVEPV